MEVAPPSATAAASALAARQVLLIPNDDASTTSYSEPRQLSPASETVEETPVTSSLPTDTLAALINQFTVAKSLTVEGPMKSQNPKEFGQFSFAISNPLTNDTLLSAGDDPPLSEFHSRRTVLRGS